MVYSSLLGKLRNDDQSLKMGFTIEKWSFLIEATYHYLSREIAETGTYTLLFQSYLSLNSKSFRNHDHYNIDELIKLHLLPHTSLEMINILLYKSTKI